MARRSKKSVAIETLKEIEILSLGVIESMSEHDKATYLLLRKIDYLIDLILSERGYPALKNKLDSINKLF